MSTTENAYARLIRGSFNILARSIDTDTGLLNRLCASEYFRSTVSEIKSYKMSEERTENLLLKLCNLSTEAVNEFIVLLRETGQDHVADLLESKCGKVYE